jgi:hypothetical protein
VLQQTVPVSIGLQVDDHGRSGALAHAGSVGPSPTLGLASAWDASTTGFGLVKPGEISPLNLANSTINACTGP